MLTKKQQAVTSEVTARNNIRQFESYQKCASAATIKLHVGELLLFGNEQRREFWQLFEVLLAQYLSVKYGG